MSGHQQLHRIKCLVSIAIFLVLFGFPPVTFAHGFIDDGHTEQTLYSFFPLEWGIVGMSVMILFGVVLFFLNRDKPIPMAPPPIKLVLVLGVISVAVIAWTLYDQGQEIVEPPSVRSPSVHEGDEGIVLGPETGESIYAAARCPADAPRRAYDLAAINIEITLNRYLDYDPQGRMYILEEMLDQVRQEEAQNKAARLNNVESAVSAGLQRDAIQPLIVRVNQGECLRLTLRNALDENEPVSLHLHGSSLHLANSGEPAIATNSDAMAQPGDTVTYEWWVAVDEPEGTHYFHSHGNDRFQTSHGLFGAVIVEPKGSTYLDPLSGDELASGWAAIIQDPNGSDFREFALVYHEIGNERYRHLNRNGRKVPQVDPYTSAYRPGDRALNYRSEPFMNRLQLQQQTFGHFDESIVYSSYAFGDPATPIARSYLGDPVKQRLIHGGSEVFHVHHVHGGATRWPRQPGLEPVSFDTGLTKRPSLLPQASERTDAQSIGPSETFDLAEECGSGGCQQGAGDFLFHCHVAHHYFAGMWGLWRVYNTLQDGSVSQDNLPPLQELPDRAGQMKPAVTTSDLVGKTVDWFGQTFDITKDTLGQWVERQLPPSGVPKGYDASVWNWHKEDDLYLNEPETDRVWPGYRSPQPGDRLPLYFDPKTGKLAYPFLRPHLGQRPPFAPNHGPAPFLDPPQSNKGTALQQPGENGPWSLCPAGSQVKEFAIHAITLPIPLNEKADLADPSGQLFVLKSQEEQVRADNRMKTPLAIRTNAGEECVDVIFKSELKDTRENNFFSKVSLHIHFVQFDVQASDGVDAGFNYEQTIRPFTVEGETLRANAAAGETEVRLDSAERFQPGILVGVGMDQDETFEIRRIRTVESNKLTFDEPLQYDHAAGEIVSTEFLRQRWYPDVQFGTAYFHDHVNALVSWKHGLFGALIAEPPGSTYHHPHSGEAIESGPVADIHTDGVVSSDVRGSFREMVLFIQDDNSLTRIPDSSGSSFNLRVEPLAARSGELARLFSSELHGDPATPLLEAYLGDPIAIRGLVSGANDVHTLHVDGHWFRQELFSPNSPPINTAHLGISERYDLVVPHAGGPQQMPGDYLYYNGRAFKLREGSWGLLRVYDDPNGQTLQKLPGHEVIPAAATTVCPADAPQKVFEVAAIDAPLPMLAGGQGKLYLLAEDKEAVLSGTKAAEPLVLHINVGDCLVVRLTNETTIGPISFHADMLAVDPKESLGVEAGYNPPQVVPPGQSRLYIYFAHPEVGETVALVRDWGNVVRNPGHGLYGAVIVGPRGARYTDPVTGADVSLKASWRVDVHPTVGPSYRDFSLFLQDEDPVIGTALMPYSEQVKGVVGLNYRLEPLAGRLSRDANTAHVFGSDAHGDPATPLLEAFAEDPVKIHVLVPYSEQAHVFTLEGHRWPQEPGLSQVFEAETTAAFKFSPISTRPQDLAQSSPNLLSSVQVGALEAITIVPLGGAGGETGLPGNYLYGDHREPYREAGLWGLFRVYAPDAVGANLRPLLKR
jgi:hypothetical protein